MTEPVLFGFPLSLLFLYFIIYAFLGWVLETIYCSVRERRFVARGFLYGPICPIYGVGVLMMLCWFAPFTGHPLLFYAVATVCMSAWEYLVGWLLETTTHIKYWDYSSRPFNLHGRICLTISLSWGVLAYLVIFWIHPVIEGLVGRLSPGAVHIAAGILLALLLADTAATIRELALLTTMLHKLNQMGEELQVQLALSRAELSSRLDEARESLSDRLDDARGSLSDRLDGAFENLSDRIGSARSALAGREAELSALRKRYNELLDRAERQSRHLRYVYRSMSSSTLSAALSQLSEASRRAKAARAEKRAERKKKK